MDIASLATAAELHALSPPLILHLEPPSCPSHVRRRSRPKRVAGMSQALAAGDAVAPWRGPHQPAPPEVTVGGEMEMRSHDPLLNSEDSTREGETGLEVEEEEEEEEEEGPPPRPGRRVKFPLRDQLVREFCDQTLWRPDPNETARDMIQAYHKECVNMKTKPIAKLLEQLERLDDLSTPIDTLDLKGVKLDNPSCEVLEIVLSRLHSTTLDLEKSGLDDEGAIALCEMVEFYACTSKINLSNNPRLRPRAWLTIGRTLKKSPFLTMVNVGYCALEEQTLTLLLRSVRANCSLQVLKMEGNNLTGKGTFILMAAMKFNENLHELWLGSNHLGPEDGQHLGSILRSNHTLRLLDLRENCLQDQGVRYICAGLAEQQEGLFVLNLTSNSISQDGVHHISAMLPCTHSLRELNLSFNKCGDNGLFMLKLGLLANRSLEKLNLSNFKMTDEGAIALAEVLAENKHITHLDLRDNNIQVAGLMGLQLAHRMNHSLVSMETPKAYRVDQRDRQLIKDLLTEIDRYCARNLQEREERAEQERRRQHEAQHAELVSSQQTSADTHQFTAGGSLGKQADAEEEEEEKEVDPSLVGSLDNVYTEAPGTMPGEDPFKRVPMMVASKRPANLMEMEKSLAAMEASIDRDSLQESDSSDETSSLDRDRRPRAKRLASENPFSRVLSPPSRDGIELGDLTPPSSEHRLLTQQEEELGGGKGEEAGEGDRMPDLVASGSSLPPDIVAPDIMARGAGLRPDLATGVTGHSRAVDLLDSANAAMPTAVRSPLDLTEGLTHLREEGGQDGEGEGEGSKQHRET